MVLEVRTPGSGITDHPLLQPLFTASCEPRSPYADGHQGKMNKTRVYLAFKIILSHKTFWESLNV